ncbi:MAG: ERF family protein [Candidatus Omnitrophica bacterium]|nr:ERF family protein [Candidatus Omnitrophota bacterium]
MAKQRGRPRKTTLPAVVKEAPIALAEEPKVPTVVDAQALIARAIDKNLPIESMERLLAMRRELRAEWARDQFFSALAGFQHECPTVEKKSKVQNKDKTLRYSYAPLEDVVETAKPFLERWGFSWTIKPTQVNGNVKASCYLHHRDGHEELTEFEVPLDPDSYMSNPQKAAAALTFARRYAFINATGIVTRGEDNDAQKEGDEPRDRKPILAPRAATSTPTPAPVLAPKNDYEKCVHYLEATEFDKVTGKHIQLFNPNEITDYTNQANIARKNPVELKIVMDDIIETGKKRRAAIKGA